MNNPTPENIPEEQAPAQNSAADKRAQKKAARKAKKEHYKQLRKELRKQKWEAFKAKTFLGKTAWVLGKVLVVLFVAVTLFTVVRVNVVDIGAAALKAFMTYNAANIMNAEVTQEQILEIAPMDEERGARIDASAPLEEGETWAIYLYMVGSDLENRTMDQLSDVANYMVQREAVPLKQEREETLNAQLGSMVDTMLANGMDLPNIMFAKTPGQSGEGGIEEQIAQAVVSDGELSGGAGSEILRKVMACPPPENVKFVLQPGGSKAWKSNLINPNRTQRFVYDSQGMHKVYEGHLSNMADPRTLVDFLTFCEEEYPADHTMLVMFNHGNAAFGYGRDAIYLEDNLTLKEMRWAFEQVYTLDEENPPIDIIGFDACIMASMEVANTLNGVASYMVASEEVQVGYGWDYTIIQNRLRENPRMNPLQLSRVAADSYMDPHAKDSVRSGTASDLCSVLDLRYADDLYQAYSDFASAALEQSTQYAGTAAYLGKTANKAIRFGAHKQTEYNTLDLGMFMQGMEDMLQEEAQAVLKVLDDMVLYNRRGNLVTDATGITVYYPATVSSLAALQKAVKYIEQVCDDPAIRALYYYKVAGCLPEEMQGYVAEQGYGEILPMNPQPLKALQKTNVTLLEDGNMILPLTDEVATITQEYRYHLLQVDENGIARRLGDSSYLLINENGELQSAFDGRWVEIDGTQLMVKVVSGTPTSVRFMAPVMHNGTRSSLLLGADLETQQWYVIGVQSFKEETSDIDVMIDRNTKLLNVGDTLIPVYEEYDIHTGVGTQITGRSITWKEDSKVEEGQLPDGDYMSYISLVDARGDVYDMQVISFEMDEGTMGDAEVVKMP